MKEELLALTCNIVSAHVAHNEVRAADLPALIRSTFETLETLGKPAVPDAAAPEPAVSIRASVKADYLICLEDGNRMTMLKRYLRTHYDMSPADYRAKWGLPRDYPMVAPNYAAKRRKIAQTTGLGQKIGRVIESVETKAEPVLAAVKTGRRTLGIAFAKAAAVAHLSGAEAPPANSTNPAPKSPTGKAD